jgi:hypothetical protein
VPYHPFFWRSQVTVKGFNGRELTEQTSGGVWSLMKKIFYSPASLSHWSVVSFCGRHRLDDQTVSNYIDGLRDALGKTGVRAPPPEKVIFAEDEQDTVSNCLRKVLRYGPGEKQGDPSKVVTQLVVCLIEKEVSIYTEVKRAAETVHGVMTQCVARDNVRKCNFMTNVNISLKVRET